MVPVPLINRHPASAAASRLLYITLSLTSKYVRRLFHLDSDVATYHSPHTSNLSKRASGLEEAPPWKRILFPVLIPILVILSGVFAGLTLGYMSLDETQLNVLSISGTPKQREYANKIKPIRKNGHLLLVTLLLANMIVNETLPVIADPVLGGGFQGVVVSTALIVIFSEIIPQSLFTRHGLYLGAKMAGFTRVLIYGLGVVSWPVAIFLEFVLGKHHGIIYRRAELKELIAMHDSHEAHGGDLKTDTVAIIGATLDLQEKVVKQAMTPIDDVFMLSIDSKLDYDLLKKICKTGHSRVPVYEEVEVPIAAVPLGSGLPSSSVVGHDTSEPPSAAMESGNGGDSTGKQQQRMVKVKKIVGILLVKQCVLLDPKDATPLRKIPLNKVPFVPNNEPLLGILDKFQEGRSHMAIVSRFSVQKAQSVKKAVKRGLTQRLRARVGMGDTDSSSSSSSDEETDSGMSGLSSAKKWAERKRQDRRRKRIISGLRKERDDEDGITKTEADEDVDVEGDGETLKEDKTPEYKFSSPPSFGTGVDGTPENIQMTAQDRFTAQCKPGKHSNDEKHAGGNRRSKDNGKKTTFQMTGSSLEQSMPADAVLAKEGAEEFLQSIDPAVMPLGIITLEDVLEELIGEEIYDEFDPQGANGDPYAYDTTAHVSGHGHTSSQVPEIKVLSEFYDQPNSDVRESHRPTTAPGIRMTSSTTGTPATGSSTARGIPIPGIPMLKGLGFLTRRSRSAPPVPRNKQKRQYQDTPVTGNQTPAFGNEQGHVEVDEKREEQEGVKSEDLSDKANGKEKMHTSASPPPMGVSGGASLEVDRDLVAPLQIRMPRPVQGVSGSTIQQLGLSGSGSHGAVTSVGAVGASGGGTVMINNSRSASPAPSLEAILLERKRRLGRESVVSAGVGVGVGTSGGATGGTTGAHVDGGRVRGFKSSPLGPGVGTGIGAGVGGAGTGAVVAERARGREKKTKEEKEKDNKAEGTKEGGGEVSK